MKQMIIMFFICGGLVMGCNSNKSSKGSSRKSNMANRPAASKQVTTASSSSEDSIKVAIKTKEEAALDSLIESQENSSQRPGLYFNGAMGPGSGGSYASSAYRHDMLNRKKYAQKALAKKQEQMKLNQSVENVENVVVTDSLSAAADSTQSSW